MLNLRNTAPAVKFRAELPAWLALNGTAFLEIDARPSGRINSAYMAAHDAVSMAHSALIAEMRKAAADGAPLTSREMTPEQVKAFRSYGRDQMAAIYDTCVIAWRTNLVDEGTGQPLICDRENFLELSDVLITEIADAIRRFVQELRDAGERVLVDTEAVAKN